MDTQLSNYPSLPQPLGYSPTEAAFMSRVSLSTINRKISSGEIKSVKVGRRRVVPRGEIERLCGVDNAESAA
jgi:excisionase family DNA binding protein